MANPKIRINFFEPDVDTQVPLVNGSVTIDGFDLELVQGGITDRVDADVKEQGLGSHLGPCESGAPFIAIPAYPNRKFRQSYIQVNSKAGIETPKDLEGKRVGISRWGMPACVWARGALQNYYGVDLTQIDWLSRSASHGTLHNTDAPNLPSGIEIRPLLKKEEPIGTDQVFDRMLLAGELDVVITANVLPSITSRNPAVRRLFGEDSKAEEQRYFKDTGIFPISHVVTLTHDFVERYPNAPVALLEAHRRARDVAFNRLEGSDPAIIITSWVAASVAEQRALMGDNYWAYNVDSNRKPLEAYVQFLYQQGLSSTKLDYESFFVPDAAALPGY